MILFQVLRISGTSLVARSVVHNMIDSDRKVLALGVCAVLAVQQRLPRTCHRDGLQGSDAQLAGTMATVFAPFELQTNAAAPVVNLDKFLLRCTWFIT